MVQYLQCGRLVLLVLQLCRIASCLFVQFSYYCDYDNMRFVHEILRIVISLVNYTTISITLSAQEQQKISVLLLSLV